MNKLLNFLSVVFGWLIWRWTGNIVIGAVVAVVLWPFIGFLFELLFTLVIALVKEFLMLFVPAQTVSLVQARSVGTDGKGLRIFLATKNFSKEAHLPPADIEAWIDAARRVLGENENFKFLDAYVTENGLPIEIYTAVYRNNLYFTKQIRTWRAATDIALFKPQDDINSFSCILNADDGKTEYAQAVFQFDSAIALPEKADASPAVQDAVSQEL